MLRILLADDHVMVRKGLKNLILETFPDALVEEAGDYAEILARVDAVPFDVVILDISLPGRSGLDALKEIMRLRPRQVVLVLSMHPPSQYAVRMIRAGASGYLNKASAPDELVLAMQRVLAGKKYIEASLGEEIIDSLLRTDGLMHESLSDREYQVFCMLGSGKSVREIAEELCLSIKTINTFRARVMKKMRMQNHSELTRYAMENGLV